MFASHASRADDAVRAIDFDIAAQLLESALVQFGAQAHVQVAAADGDVSGLKTDGVTGRRAIEDALAQLLRGTGLEYRKINERTYRVSRPARALMDADGESGEPFLEEIVVTGTHIRGGVSAGSKVIVIDRGEIDRTGLSTVHDVVRTLPQSFGGGVSEDTRLGIDASRNSARSTAINLRGLGAGATLVLVNGRRLAPGGTEGTFTDVSSIPLSAVERIDVLPDGASAIYGSEAVGGVVNFVLRKDYQGAETRARVGGVTSGGLREYQFGQALGDAWGAGQGFISYEFHSRDALPASERVLTADSDLRPLGGGNFSTNFNNPGTIVSGTRTWAIPTGQDGSSLVPGSFTLGTVNPGNRNEGRDLLPETKRHGLFGTVSQEIGSITLFAEGLFARRETGARNPGLGTTLTVPAINPFHVNPLGTTAPVQVAYSFYDDLGPLTFDVEIDTLSATAGVTVPLGERWQGTVYASYAAEEQDQIQGNINQAALTAALADPNPATAFNPFGDGSFTNPATLDAIRAQTFFETESDVRVANVLVDGPLFGLPAGELRLAVGAEYREYAFDSSSIRPGVAPTLASYERDLTAAFAELSVPLVGPDNSRLGLRRLDLSLAGRYERYSDFGDTTVPKAGLSWAPARDILLHGTWSRSFKAPNVADLNEEGPVNVTRIFTVSDPLAPSGTSPVLAWFGKNAQLSEERARAWTAGLELTPSAVGGLRLDFTYFDIAFEDRIEQPPVSLTWLREPRFAAIVTRNPTSAQRDQACSRSPFVGANPADCRNAPISALVDLRTNNTAVTQTSGIDLLASYSFRSRVGYLQFGINASYLLEFEQALLASEPPLSLVDTATNPVALRGRGSVSWSHRGFSASAFVNHADEYMDTVSQPNVPIDDWTTLDLQLGYEVAKGAGGVLDGTALTLSAQNVFDEDPPFYSNPVGIGYDPENADLMGRFVSLQLRKIW